MLHREAEFEQAELERALAISLAIEEERLRSLALIDRDHELDHSLSSEAKIGVSYSYNTAKVCIPIYDIYACVIDIYAFVI